MYFFTILLTFSWEYGTEHRQNISLKNYNSYFTWTFFIESNVDSDYTTVLFNRINGMVGRFWYLEPH